MAIDLVALGKRVSYYRNQQGLTQKELGDALYISRKHIAQLEIGMSGPSVEFLVLLSTSLGVSIDDLLADSLESAPKATAPQLFKVLVDCTPQEERILAKALVELKSILASEGI